MTPTGLTRAGRRGSARGNSSSNRERRSPPATTSRGGGAPGIVHASAAPCARPTGRRDAARRPASLLEIAARIAATAEPADRVAIRRGRGGRPTRLAQHRSRAPPASSAARHSPSCRECGPAAGHASPGDRADLCTTPADRDEPSGSPTTGLRRRSLAGEEAEIRLGIIGPIDTSGGPRVDTVRSRWRAPGLQALPARLLATQVLNLVAPPPGRRRPRARARGGGGRGRGGDREEDVRPGSRLEFGRVPSNEPVGPHAGG